jgi:transporter family-2 protein
MGIIFSALAGILMSLQGVFNTRLSEKVGLWETTAIVNIVGLIVSLCVLFFLGDGNIKKVAETNYFYLLGGVLGVGITFTVMKGILKLGTTHAIATILIAQLLAAALIDACGLFNTKQVCFDFYKIGGIVLMIAGIVLFKWR